MRTFKALLAAGSLIVAVGAAGAVGTYEPLTYTDASGLQIQATVPEQATVTLPSTVLLP